nr:molecular chaperone [Providencia rettgeri]
MMNVLGLSIAQAAAPSDSEGIALGSTRVIYPASAKNGITFTVTNRTGQVYLLQSRIVPWAQNVMGAVDNSIASVSEPEAPPVLSDPDTTTPFIVLPPLTRFAPEEAMTLRIRLIKNTLPADRESLFSLSLKAIPSQEKPSSNHDAAGAKMVLALQNNLKLFYRPEGLTVMSAAARAEALEWRQRGTQLVLKNPTPYYVTLGTVSVDSTPLDLGSQRMLAPFASATYAPMAPSSQSVSWQLINDEGQRTPLQTRPLR